MMLEVQCYIDYVALEVQLYTDCAAGGTVGHILCYWWHNWTHIVAGGTVLHRLCCWRYSWTQVVLLEVQLTQVVLLE